MTRFDTFFKQIYCRSGSQYDGEWPNLAVSMLGLMAVRRSFPGEIAASGFRPRRSPLQ